MRSLLFIAALAASCTCAFSQGYYEHTIQRGDTLEAIARKYLKPGIHWNMLQRSNRIGDPNYLTPGALLRLPISQMLLLPVESVSFEARGTVQVKAAAEARAWQQTSPVIQEGDQVNTGPDGFAMIHLNDGSVVKVVANSRVTFVMMRASSVAPVHANELRVESGRVTAQVNGKGKVTSMRVRSPLAIAAVRGTRFGVSVQEDDATAIDVKEGKVEVLQTSPSDDHSRKGGEPVTRGLGAVVRGRRGAAQTKVIPLLAAPELQALQAEYRVTKALDLPFGEVAGASSYLVEVASDSGFQHTLISLTVPEPSIHLESLPEGPYFVRISAVTADGLAGLESVASFKLVVVPEAPFALSPAEDAQLAPGQVELACAQTPGVDAYRLQIAADRSFSNIIARQEELTQCRHTFESLAPGVYYWRAMARIRLPAGGFKDGAYGATRSFTVIEPLKTPQVLPRPNKELEVSWTGQPGRKYRAVVSGTPSFSQVALEQTSEVPRLAVSTLAPGLYYVKVQEIANDGRTGPYSTAQSFEILSTLKATDGATIRDSSGAAARTQP